VRALDQYASNDGSLLVIGENSLQADEYDQSHDTVNPTAVIDGA
jgi:hypothetical protein